MNVNSKKEKYVSLKYQLAYSTLKSNYENQYSDELECSHDIVILVGYNKNEPIYKCMACGESVYDDIENKIIIDASNYNTYSFDLNNEFGVFAKYNLVKNHIIQTLHYNPGITNGKLETIVNQSINGRSYQKRKVS